jgi:Fe-S cluster assembly protein SufD
MSALSAALAERLSAQHADTARALGEPAASAAQRRRALDALLDAGLPSSRDENWKYANLRPLEKLRYLPASLCASAAAPPVDAAILPAALPGYARYVFVDGALAPALSMPLAGTAVTLALRDGASAAATAASGDERFALLNAAFAAESVAVGVRAAAEGRLELLYIASAEAALGASYPRLEVELQPGARLALIERHLSAGEAPSFVNSAVTLALGAGANLTHYRLQDLSNRSIHLDTLSAALAERATYRLNAAAFGGQAARSTLRVRLEGARAELKLAMTALGDRQQVQDSYAVVEHAAPDTRTEQTFRGIAAGRARVACNGKIVVTRAARGSDSRQSLRGLLAGPEAEIDVRPQLEIYTDDVRCSHGATAGKLDDNMLFYLLSRGLDRESAQRALKWAFLEDVVARIEVPELRRQIEERLADRLHDGAALRELW